MLLDRKGKGANGLILSRWVVIVLTVRNLSMFVSIIQGIWYEDHYDFRDDKWVVMNFSSCMCEGCLRP